LELIFNQQGGFFMMTKAKDSQDGENSSYYCPIHPEFLKDKPGACSRCGMTLSKDTTTETWKDEPQ
jgi:hypothetical protein